ncbi:MAG: hypothetical protein CM1200mP30_25460 [Pseudomonadota bacterium]|nr:MAG: hypothetical protein CM1200mP30_25460 [Pseudomonadota bacterium]
MTPTLRKAKALKADLLVVSGHLKGAATAGRQVIEMKVNVPMIAVTHCESAKLIKKFGSGVNGFLCPTQWAETLTYSGRHFGTQRNTMLFLKPALTVTKTYHTKQHRHLQLFWYGLKHLKCKFL